MINNYSRPIIRQTGGDFKNIDEARKAFEEEASSPQSGASFIYTRYGNPTVIETETELAKLENSIWALSFPSGMSAIETSLSIFQEKGKTGPLLFFSEVYGGTNAYIDEVLVKRRDINVKRFYPRDERFDIDELVEVLDTEPKPKLLFFEPVTNPLLIAVDGIKVIEEAKKRGITVVVDNTFPTPYLWHPLSSGADIVVHSATKYLSGHGNITAGVMTGNDPAIRQHALLYRKLTGSILSPDDAYRLGTQLKTFNLRFPKQAENARKLAIELEKHPAVSRVRYPGLETHTTYEEAKKLFSDSDNSDFGAMVTFDLKGGRKACDKFLAKAAHHISYVPTLGDAESILLHVSTVFGGQYEDFEGMLRLSVGFDEPYEGLWNGLKSALDSIAEQENIADFETGIHAIPSVLD